MKHTHCLPVILLALVFVSCKKNPVALKENYIPVNGCRFFEAGGKILRLCLDSVIQNSRCPTNAICIWAGFAVGRFSITAGNESRVITLATTSIAGFNKDSMVEGFKIEFIDLRPYTVLDKPFSYNEYVAEVKVTKQ